MRPILHVPEPPAAPGPLRDPGGDARRRARAALSRRAGAGAVRRRRRARVQPALGADELVGRDGADRACHRFGWPVARGGSRAITDALAAVVREHGGTIETGRRVASLDELPRGRRGRPRPRAREPSPSSPATGCRAGSRAPIAATGTGPARSRSTSRSRAGCPGRTSAARRAGTVHAVGSFEEMVAAEREVNRGPDAGAAVRPRLPAVPRRPDALQRRRPPDLGLRPRPQRLRRRRDRGDARPDRAVRARAARADRRRRRRARRPRSRPHNANYVGGDIITGANTPKQMLFRPRARRSTRTRPGSPASTSARRRRRPGAGAHGMNGYNAARSALRAIERA